MEKEYIQITSGRGPVECCRVVVLVMNKIIKQAKSLGYEVEVVEHEDGSNDGCMFSATLAIEGNNIFSLKSEWEGSVHRRIPSVRGIVVRTGLWVFISSNHFRLALSTIVISPTRPCDHQVQEDRT